MEFLNFQKWLAGVLPHKPEEVLAGQYRPKKPGGSAAATDPAVDPPPGG